MNGPRGWELAGTVVVVVAAALLVAHGLFGLMSVTP